MTTATTRMTQGDGRVYADHHVEHRFHHHFEPEPAYTGYGYDRSRRRVAHVDGERGNGRCIAVIILLILLVGLAYFVGAKGLRINLGPILTYEKADSWPCLPGYRYIAGKNECI